MWMQMASLKCMASGQIWRVLIHLTISSSAVFYLLVSRCFGSRSVNVRHHPVFHIFSQSSSFQVTNKVVWWHPPKLWCLWCFGSRLLIWCARLLSQENSEIKGKQRTHSHFYFWWCFRHCVWSPKSLIKTSVWCVFFSWTHNIWSPSVSLSLQAPLRSLCVCVLSCVCVFYNAWSTK